MSESSVKWTKEQELAIKTQAKNLLVSAAAGAGKTAVLVQRVIESLISGENPLDIERLLVVTFTEKAAVEMKERVRAVLQKVSTESPGDGRILRQLALLDRAHISTIHSFCLYVVRRYFYKLNLDPSFRVLDANEAYILLLDSLDEVLETWYQKRKPEFLELLACYGGPGMDEGLKELLLFIYEFAITQPDLKGWLQESIALLDSMTIDMPLDDYLGLPWVRVLLNSALRDARWCMDLTKKARILADKPNGPSVYVPSLDEELCIYEEMLDSMTALCLHGKASEEMLENSLAKVQALLSYEFARLPGEKGAAPDIKERVQELRNKAKSIFKGISNYAFLRPRSAVLEEVRKLAPLVQCVKDIILDLDDVFSKRKLERRGLDFSDLERYCLKALSQENGEIRAEIRQEFDQILVDEYQDTNPIQEAILKALRGQGQTPSVFMVGDIKQSIYRFRLAEPRIFLQKLRAFKKISAEDPIRVFGTDEAYDELRIDLSLNFRSRKEVIEFVNYIFSRTMKEETAEIEYDESHRLQPGALYPESPKEVWGENPYVPEVYIINRDRRETSEEPQEAPKDSEELQSDSEDVEEYEALEKEALVVAERIKAMMDPAKPLMVWDNDEKRERPLAYKDIAILMRATKERVNALLEILTKSGIPAASDTGSGYFQAYEIQVVLSLLSVIDNPRQDIPLAAVLRSPIVGLTPEQLALVKSEYKIGKEKNDEMESVAPSSYSLSQDFYDAVEFFIARKDDEDPLKRKLSRFMADLDDFRTMARRQPLSRVLWVILRDTGFYDYVGGLPGGNQRQSNLRALLDRAAQYDSMGRHGLFRFLQFIDRIREKEGDLGTARALGEKEDVVEILSIHKAKGLEFPLVFLLDLGRRFNQKDERKDILVHTDLGICPIYCDLELKTKYPTLLYQACAKKITEDNLAEEMRILYVGMTRAREKLIMVGSSKDLESRLDSWKEGIPKNPQSFLDWIGPCVVPVLFEAEESPENQAPFKVFPLGIQGYPSVPSLSLESSHKSSQGLTLEDVKNLRIPKSPPDLELLKEIHRRLGWTYSHRKYSGILGKISVGQVKQRLWEDDSIEGRLEDKLRFQTSDISRSDKSAALERGIAVHSLLANINLDEVSKGQKENLDEVVGKEYRRLFEKGFLGKEELGKEDLAMVSRFFATPSGRFLVENREKAEREVPFTLKVPVSQGDEGDFVVLQGVIDALIRTDEGLTILDYKTDRVAASALSVYAQKYASQVSLYALAAKTILSQPFNRAFIIFLWPGLEVEIEVEKEISHALSLFQAT